MRRLTLKLVPLLALGLCLSLLLSPSTPADARGPTPQSVMKSAAAPRAVSDRLSRYVPARIGVQKGRTIPPSMKVMLAHLVQASDHVDAVYWSQVSPNGLAVRKAAASSNAQAARELVALMNINYGPWDRHRDDAPFVGSMPRPPGANFYPADTSRRELEAWMGANPKHAEAARNPYTVLRREAGDLTVVPYATAYGPRLKQAANSLRAAADAYRCSEGAREAGKCPCDGFASYLRLRADSLLSDDYVPSEMAWLETAECPLDIAIGPYEFYEDRLMGLKTAFESIITLSDAAESKRFSALAAQRGDLITKLPVSAATRHRFKAVAASPITIADALYTAGDARAGYQMRAFVLPNDPVVRRAKGSKNVILRNVVEAKFNALTRPTAKRVLSKKTQKNVSFDTYFDILLSWQLAHDIEPEPTTQADGTTVSSREQLRERYTVIESVKGEAVALLNYLHLADKGLLKGARASKLGATYLVTLFDSLRLGGHDPQTIAKTIVYNYFADNWVFRYNPRGRTFEVNPPALRKAAERLASESLEVMARGDYDGAGRMIVQYGIMTGEMRQKLATMDDMPLDIRPEYVSVGPVASSL